MSIKIVADSSADILNLEGVDFSFAPLKIVTTDKEFCDDENLNVEEMINFLKDYKGKSSSSCPNCNDFLRAFGDAKEIICFTISGNISGSYNAALMAKDTFESEHQGCKVFVIDTLSAGPEITLAIYKARSLILEGLPFDEVCEKTVEYTKNTGLVFVLESLQNFANNGRVSHLTAKMAGVLGIRVVCKASDDGLLEPISKCRGESNSFNAIIKHLEENGLKEGKVFIAHCLNESGVKTLSHLIEVYFPNVEISVFKNRGLCSFYAEKGGILVAFEKC